MLSSQRWAWSAVCVTLVLAFVGCQRQPGAADQPAPPVAQAAPDQGTTDEYWQNALLEVYKTPLELLGQHQSEQRRGFTFPKVLRGAPGRREVAITFDDGPHTKYTPQLLAVLRKYNAKATFLVVGQMAEAHPELVKAELADGHNVGNHTYHHVNLTKIPQRLVATEILACDQVLRDIGVPDPHLFRPPGGDYNKQVAQVIRDCGQTLVLWTDDPGDYASPGATVIENRTLRMISSGGIILLHDGVQETVDVLPQLLQYLKARGLRTVTVDEMIRSLPAAKPLPATLKPAALQKAPSP